MLPTVILPTPDGPSTSNATNSTTPTVKLRDSCHACASSKLRCTKEKPTCSRCAKRGKSCQYFVTRRAGRKHASKSSIQVSTETNPASAAPAPPPGQSAQSCSSAWKRSSQSDVTTSQPPATTAAATAGSTIHVNVLRDQYTNNNYDDFNSDLMTTTSSRSSALQTPGELIMNFDDFYPSPKDLSMVDGSDVSNGAEYFFGQSCLPDPVPDATMPWTQLLDKAVFNLGRDLRTLHGSADLELMPSISSTQSSTRNHPPPSQTQSRPHHHQRPPQEDHEGQQQQQQQQEKNQRQNEQKQQKTDSRPAINDPSCSCVAQTLGLVSQLFQEPATSTSPPTSPMAWSPGSSVSSHDRMLATGSANASFADGEHAIETIRSMLQCPRPCQQDRYLLALMSLVVFKALARYEDAARRSTEDAETLAQTSLYGASSTKGRRLMVDEDNPHPKLAVQAVLVKLHRVQGLVNTLSQRLRTNKTGPGKDIDTRAESSSVKERQDSTDGSVPFSTTFLCQLEEDLRKQVRSISSRLVNTLRQL